MEATVDTTSTACLKIPEIKSDPEFAFGLGQRFWASCTEVDVFALDPPATSNG
ncbi:hypothetical protein ACFVTX_05670 [Agromyces sp. NPDC058136]|uniref:hypothetical protein n=1 Tax=Agromyces sp. NPDC058136 TaxID=3346354 RepID=UPI0036D98874